MAPLDGVLDIDGNPYVLDRLRALVRSRRAIAFAGAGASAGLYPLWPELVRLLVGEAAKRGLATEADRATWERLAAARPQQVVRGVREHLGSQVYGAVLRELFGLRSDPWHTEVQGLLVRLPFRGHVTTNYDPGLLEARRLLRPDVPATGYATWRDHDALRAWHTGDAFGDHACPVLYAPGVFERTDTIVLGAGEYREAYRPGPFRELVRALWSREHLVFVGFGFNDAWFDTVAEEALGLTREGAGEPRHVAVLGLPAGEPYSRELRTMFRDAYDAEVLLYPVAGGDHSLLGAVLAELARAHAAPPPVPAPPISPRPVERWVHETTEDEHYTEPAGVLSRLDRWAADPRVRVIAVTGIGGLGKTALVGHWLKGRSTGRAVRGLFGWSFNANRSVPECLRALAEFAGLPADGAPAALRGGPLVVVLDALEILQEPPGDPAAGTGWLEHGQFLDHDLRAFLDAACRLDHGGLVVLTSRFPFADLTGELGGAVRLLELERLTPEEGARLLARLEVGGSDSDRETVSRRLEGHPLALRVFAAALARQARSDPSRLLEVPFAAGDLRQDDPLEAKVRELLAFYERQLPPAWRELLGVVALFPDEVELASIAGLGRNLPGVRDQLAGVADGALRGALAALAGGRAPHLGARPGRRRAVRLPPGRPRSLPLRPAGARCGRGHDRCQLAGRSGPGHGDDARAAGDRDQRHCPAAGGRPGGAGELPVQGAAGWRRRLQVAAGRTRGRSVRAGLRIRRAAPAAGSRAAVRQSVPRPREWRRTPRFERRRVRCGRQVPPGSRGALHRSRDRWEPRDRPAEPRPPAHQSRTSDRGGDDGP